jgi:hypothetical protein
MNVLLALAVAGLLLGCDLSSQRVGEAEVLYQAIRWQSSSNEVFRALGPPLTVDSWGLRHWRTVGMSTNNFAELTVGFNSEGRIWFLHEESSLK